MTELEAASISTNSKPMPMRGLTIRTIAIASTVSPLRVSVTRAVKIALRKINDHHAALGQHLATTIKTGTYCSYTPDVRMPISWQA